MSERLACCVPGCRRTRKADGFTEWCCGIHWAAVSPHLKRRKSKLYRRYRRRHGSLAYWAYKGGSPERIACVKLSRLCDLAWKRCKVQAIERAMGIG